jgi:flagellar protein FliO/FliZ
VAYGADGLASLSLTAAVVAALLWFALLALRRLRSGSPAAGGGDCRVMRTLAVGPRERILVVAVGSRQLVVGVGSAAVSLLCELDAPLPAPAAATAGLAGGLRQVAARWRR